METRMNCPNCEKLVRELLSAQAAIDAALKAPWTDVGEILAPIDLSALHDYDAKVREPLVAELENIRNANPEEWRKDFGPDVYRQFTRWAQNRAAHALDALAKVKEQ